MNFNKYYFIENNLQNSNFKRWFNKSKVVDNSGNPLKLYHGTNNKFEIFNSEKGIWCISDSDEALEYGKIVIPVYVSIQNPYISSHEENTKLGSKRIINKAKLLNKDGIYFPKDEDFYQINIYYEAQFDVWVAFESNQVKHIDNKIFSLQSDNINEVNNKNVLIVYHGTNNRFNKFNFKNAVQKIIGFSSNIEDVKTGKNGARGSKYIIKMEVKLNNPAGWDEYDKYSLDELQQKGFDGAILKNKEDYDGFVFNPNQIKIIEWIDNK